jgi:ComF family protein
MVPPGFVRAVAYGPYEGRMRDAIHALKYDRVHSVARPLGVILAETISRLGAEALQDMLVIPVPLHRSKSSQRGFNQARLIAARAVAVLRRTHPEWHLRLAPTALVRERATRSQASLAPRERRENVRGAFRVADPKTVNLKHILVVDDIFTTGATARSISKELLRAGAASVRVATLARAQLAFVPHRRREAAVTEAGIHRKDSGVAGDLPAATRESASMLSSSNQPSF